MTAKRKLVAPQRTVPRDPHSPWKCSTTTCHDPATVQEAVDCEGGCGLTDLTEPHTHPHFACEKHA